MRGVLCPNSNLRNPNGRFDLHRARIYPYGNGVNRSTVIMAIGINLALFT